MKVISTIAGTPPMSKEEVNTFLENKLNLQFGTIDDDGGPNIQPVWFGYDKDREKFLIITPKATKKIKNLRIRRDPVRTVPEAKKIYMKYLGILDHPIPRMILESVQKGNHVIIEINPKFFSTWVL